MTRKLIGRFIEIDPLSDDYEYNSTYAFSENKVISHVELEGLEAVEIIVSTIEAVGVGVGVTAGIAAVAIVAVATHPEILLSGGSSAAQMDFKLERQLLKASSSSTNTTASSAQIASSGGAMGQAGRALAQGGKYSHLKEPKDVGPGKKTTPAQRKRILEENKKQNNGQLVSDGDGKPVNRPQKLKSGDKRDPREAQVDHIVPAKPKDKTKQPGTNSNSNLQVLSGEENNKKKNN